MFRHCRKAVRRRASKRGRRGYRQLLSAPARWPDCRNRVGNAGKPLGRTEIGTARYQAFNNIYARHLLERGRPRGSPGRIALPVAGDDAKAKAVVLQLIDELGFDAVDAGGLDDSWRQQPGTPVYTTDLDAEGVRKALSAARRQRTPAWTATPGSPGNFTNPA